jgi:hypothetical protein
MKNIHKKFSLVQELRISAFAQFSTSILILKPGQLVSHLEMT